jgi:hypothetical protein
MVVNFSTIEFSQKEVVLQLFKMIELVFLSVRSKVWGSSRKERSTRIILRGIHSPGSAISMSDVVSSWRTWPRPISLRSSIGKNLTSILTSSSESRVAFFSHFLELISSALWARMRSRTCPSRIWAAPIRRVEWATWPQHGRPERILVIRPISDAPTRSDQEGLLQSLASTYHIELSSRRVRHLS